MNPTSTSNPNDFPFSPDDLSVEKPKMIAIPEGWFWMGIPDKKVMKLYQEEDWAREWYEKGMFRAEQPQTKVHLNAYEIGKYPVTNADYYQFIWKSSYKVPKGWIGFRFPEGYDLHPVVGISMKDALAYCDWLSKVTELKYRLPTEPEWERGAAGVDCRVYPWGDTFDPWRCNTLDSGKNGTTAVGSYSPAGDSAAGLADMAGNIYELTSDKLYPYPYGEIPPNAAREIRYVMRGGAFYYSHKLARCSSREGTPSDFTSPAIGFRLARSL